VTATCRFGDRTALKSISEEMESGRPPLISRGIQTVPITNCAVTLPDADESALEALSKIRNRAIPVMRSTATDR